MATIPRSKRFRKTDDLEDKAMKMRIVADSSANLLEMKNVEFASVPVHIIVGEQDYADTARCTCWRRELILAGMEPEKIYE